MIFVMHGVDEEPGEVDGQFDGFRLGLVSSVFLLCAVLAVAALNVMSSTNKKKTSENSSNVIPKRVKKVRSVSISVDLDCSEKAIGRKSKYNLHSYLDDRNRTVSSSASEYTELLYTDELLDMGRFLSRPKFPFQQMPQDCKIKIFSYLSPQDKGKAALVCTEWNTLVKSPSLWGDIDFTVFPLCYRKGKKGHECNKLCYSLYKSRIKSYMSFLQTVKPSLTSLKMAFDFGDHEDCWFTAIEEFCEAARFRELESLKLNWRETTEKPLFFEDSQTWTPGECKDISTKERRRTRRFVYFFDKFTAASPMVQEVVLPFDWSKRSLQCIKRLENLKTLVLENYFRMQPLSQDNMNQLFQSLHKLENLVVEVWTASGKGLSPYTICNSYLKHIDISKCRGIYLDRVDLPNLEIIQIGRQPWCGPLVSFESDNVPCLHEILSEGAPRLKKINDHNLREDWKDEYYEDLEMELEKCCPCPKHKWGATE